MLCVELCALAPQVIGLLSDDSVAALICAEAIGDLTAEGRL